MANGLDNAMFVVLATSPFSDPAFASLFPPRLSDARM